MPRRQFVSILIAGSLSGGIALAACSDDASVDPPEGAVFEVLVCEGSELFPLGETFHALILEPAAIAEANARIGQGEGRILIGDVVKGDGGFNAPWLWHLDPPTVGFRDATVEACDGCPTLMQADLDDYIANVGQYCPWSAQIVARTE